MSAETRVAEVFAHAGITLGGTKPWDIRVHDKRFFNRIITGGSLALGESYVDGWWDAPRLDQTFARIHAADLRKHVRVTPSLAFHYAKASILNRQSKRRARIVGEKHYDKGNDLYEAMLDPTMAYSCGYWRDAKTLAAAQRAKYELICKKLGLKKGMRVLDIGCGWGGFLIYAAKKYGITGVGITISVEQATLARERAKGLPIEIRVQDYRKLRERFERIVSVGMFEHVGYKNYKTYMRVVRRCLTDDGLFLLHTIGSNRSTKATDPWIEKYIFPNGMLPSVAQIGKAMENVFVLEDWHSFGAHYDKTLMAWDENFRKAWPRLKNHYDERFYRMWRYYLMASAGGFRVRKLQLWQLVLSTAGVRGGYERPKA
jgi:cyclopropane-fatty-acyl-phospholipid synthase